MNTYFTICSNNYLGYAKVLARSIKAVEPSSTFLLILCDEQRSGIDYSFTGDEIIEAASIEPDWHSLTLKYNIVELNTCIKPRVFEYLFLERSLPHAIYLDPDIRVYQPMDFLAEELQQHTILLTPHVSSPIDHDGKGPSENTFLNFGIYNLGFIAVANNSEAHRFLSWWKGHTYRQCYIDVYKGIFTDQLPINLAPIFFNGVEVLLDKGLNMAPWNLHERLLSFNAGHYQVNEETLLLFYHFSCFKPGSPDLPYHFYNRYRLSDRPDLVPLYQEYNTALLEAGQAKYALIPYAYEAARKRYLRDRKRKKWMKKLGL